ncbi:MAG: signal recognition particle-docking protein FtsY [Haloarculaceae archaeon]
MFDGLKEKLGRFKEDVEPEQDGEGAAADAPADEGAGSEPTEQASGSAAEGDPDDRKQGVTERAKLFASGRAIITEEELEEPLEQLELELLQGDVEMSVAREITGNLREELVGETRAQVQTGQHMVERAIGDALYDVISVGQFDFEERVAEADKPVTIVFTGVNGVGKTTTIAKLARRFEELGLSVVLANGDTYRAGANEQIREHADRLGTKLISHEQGGDPAAVIYDAVEYAEANGIDVVLGDTAGRLHTSDDLMSQLSKIDRVVDPEFTLFVDEAVAGQDATQRAEKFNDAAEIDGVVLTKADADANGGAAVSVAHVTGKPILYLGVGQEYDDIERFDPQVIVDRLVDDEAA